MYIKRVACQTGNAYWKYNKNLQGMNKDEFINKLKNDKDTSFFLISSIISIFYSVLNYPLYVFPLPHTMWICLEYLGLFYLFYFIIKTRK